MAIRPCGPVQTTRARAAALQKALNDTHVVLLRTDMLPHGSPGHRRLLVSQGRRLPRTSTRPKRAVAGSAQTVRVTLQSRRWIEQHRRRYIAAARSRSRVVEGILTVDCRMRRPDLTWCPTHWRRVRKQRTWAPGSFWAHDTAADELLTDNGPNPSPTRSLSCSPKAESSTSAPSPTGPRPTAMQSASTAPWLTGFLVPASSIQKPTAGSAWPAVCTTTTATGTTPPSADRPLHALTTSRERTYVFESGWQRRRDPVPCQPGPPARSNSSADATPTVPGVSRHLTALRRAPCRCRAATGTNCRPRDGDHRRVSWDLCDRMA